MALLKSNFATGRLSTLALSTDTALLLSTGNGAKFPSPTGGDIAVLVIEDASGNKEIVHLTARNGDTLTVTRAQEGTSALQFAVGSRVEVRITNAVLEDFVASSPISGKDQIITPRLTTDVPLGVKKLTSQTSNLFQITDEADADLFVVSANAALSGAFTVGTNLIPTASNTYDLGSDALPWKDIWFRGNVHFDEGGSTTYLGYDFSGYGNNVVFNNLGVKIAQAGGGVRFNGWTSSGGGPYVSSPGSTGVYYQAGTNLSAGAHTWWTDSSTDVMILDETKLLLQGIGFEVGGISTFGGNLLPSTANTYDLGSDALPWKDIWFRGALHFDEGGSTTYLDYDFTTYGSNVVFNNLGIKLPNGSGVNLGTWTSTNGGPRVSGNGNNMQYVAGSNVGSGEHVWWINSSTEGMTLSSTGELLIGDAPSDLGAYKLQVTGNGYFDGTLTATGAFTSVGIDDNATAEAFDLTDAVAIWGNTTDASFNHRRPDEDGYMLVTGGGSITTGGNIRLFGDSHATLPGDIQFRNGTAVVGWWDESADSWTWTGTNHIVEGTTGVNFYLDAATASNPQLIFRENKIAEGKLYWAAASNLMALKAENGSELWLYENGNWSLQNASGDGLSFGGSSITADFSLTVNTNFPYLYLVDGNAASPATAGGVLAFKDSSYVNAARFGIPNENNIVVIEASDSAGVLSFRAGGSTERARLDAVGNFLVGTTDTTLFANTTGEGVMVAADQVQVARSGAAPMSLNRMTDEGMIVSCYQAGTYKGGLAVSSNIPVLRNSSGQQLTPDYYATGTFAPYIYGSTATGTASYSTQTGTYTRIGNVVTFSIWLTWSSHTGTGDMRIWLDGFQLATSSPFVTAIYPNGLSVAANASVVAYGIAGNSFLGVYESAGGAATAVSMSATGTVVLSGSFRVA